MNRVTHKIILDIKSTVSQQTLDVYLNDSARRLEIAFAEDNLSYKISSGCRAVFTAEKPDGTILYNDCAIIGNSVVFDFTQNPQIANVLGEVNCQVKLYGTENDLITSPRFTLVVHKTVYREGDAVESSSEFTALTKLITEANKALEDIGDIENILNSNIFPDSFELWNEWGNISAPVIGQALSPNVLEPNAVYRIRIVPGKSYNFTSTPLGSEFGVFFAVADKDGICLDFTTESIDKYDVRSDYDGTVPAYIYYGVADINNISSIEFRGETPTNVGTIKVEQTSEGAIVTAIDKDGTTTAVIRNGKDGETPYIKDGFWWIGDTNTNVKAKGADGYTPQKGADYFTETDKQELVNELASKAPVKSVNGKTGAVNLSADDVGARASTWMPSYSDVGAEKSGTATAEVGTHNTSETSHNDIRLLIEGLTTRLNTLANSDDTTLDQMAEVVSYIKDNRELIEQITTGKVSVTDIVDNLTTNVSNKPLSAKQGVALKALIDAITVPTLLSQLDEDASHRTVTDTEKQAWNNKSEFSGKYSDLTGKPTIPSVPSKISAFENDKGYLTEHQDLSAYAKKVDIPTVTQEAGQSESLVMSQKAVTDLVNDALGENSGTEYETVDSIDKMTDTSKSYVLSTTGTIWSYGETTVTVEPPNKFVPSKASLNYRLSGSSGTASANAAANGSFVTDFIAVSNMATIDPYIMRANWGWDGTGNGEDKIVYYDSNKTRLGNTVFDVNNRKNVTVLDGEFLCSLKVNEYESINVSNWADVAFIRLQLFVKPKGTSITSADIANLTITFDHEGGTKTENAWYDTGLTPSASGGGGGNYVDLLVKINQNKTDIAEVLNRVTALETGSETLTIPIFWQSAVDACISKIKALQVGRNCVTFPFFSDNHQRNGYAGMLIAKVMKECSIPYCFYGGDSISSGYIEDEAAMIAEDKAFDTIMSYVPNGRFCRAVGNHDGFWNVSSATGDEYHYTDAQIYELFLREESIAQNKHFGGDGTYYYVDDIASKVRWVVLDTNDSTVEAEQISWLQNTALTFNESGWAVVFISHQPISNHYHALISNSAEVRTVVKNYINGSSTNKADVVGWFSGHIHRDRIYTGIATNTTDDSQGTAMGFTQVTITSDHTSIAYDDATKHTVANDDQSHAIDFVTINKTTRKVNITRLGIGNDRSYTY